MIESGAALDSLWYPFLVLLAPPLTLILALTLALTLTHPNSPKLTVTNPN